MHLCRFNGTSLGLIEGDEVIDVTSVLGAVQQQSWPQSLGDHLIRHLPELRGSLEQARSSGARHRIQAVSLNSPIVSPTKIMAAPANYRKHVELDTRDPAVDQGVHRDQMLGVEKPVYTYGLFLKASSSLVGPSEGITIDWPHADCRVDHEVEIAVVMGKTARHVKRADALNYIAGYSIGLDITVRGKEDRSFRKSADSFAVLGPWLSSPDQIDDPTDIRFGLSVNGELRQQSSTSAITVPIDELIEFASSAYTLHPGDIILTGTPEGVGPIEPGDQLVAWAAGIGEMSVQVRGVSR
jgi:2,4-diketo-3-deoxy-L-fuconate hydrolase